jgi:hypothetical protein
VGDAQEGTLSSLMAGHTIDPSDPSTIPPQFVRVLQTGRITFQEGATLTIGEKFREQADDCYVFSTSLVPGADAMAALGYDSCVEIQAPDRFFRSLTSALRSGGHPVDEPLTASVEYTPREAEFRQQTSMHPAFVKEPRYEYQHEHRAVWFSAESSISPTFLVCTDLVSFVRLVT